MNNYTIKVLDDLYVNPLAFQAIKMIPGGGIEYHAFSSTPQLIEPGPLADAYQIAVTPLSASLATVMVNVINYASIEFATGRADIIYPHGYRTRLTGEADITALRQWCDDHQFATEVVVEFDGA